MWDLCFDARATAAGEPNMVGGPLPQLLVEFVAAPANGFGMPARDLCDLLQPAMSQTLRLTARDPATLLLVQATEQYLELPMLRSIGMFPRPACSPDRHAAQPHS